MRFTSSGRVGLLVSAALLTTLAACTRSGGDLANGKKIYAVCQGCHKPTENYVGPKHCGLIGRAAASVPDFDYSEGMRASGLTWDAKTLDQFLTSPVAFVNGTKMGFAGLESPTDRADVIAYIRSMNDDPAICPKAK